MLATPAVAENKTYQACQHGPPAPNQTEKVITEERLIIDTRHLYQPNSTHKYEVFLVEGHGTNRERIADVTEEANISSENTSLITVNESGKTFRSTENENVSTWVRVNAETANHTGCTNIMLGSPTVQNMKILPGIWRFEAVLSDPFLFALLIATFLSVAVTRFTTAFGGLAIGQIVLTFGWFGGWVPWVYAVVSVFLVMFIGFNLAQNTEFIGSGFR